MGKIGNCFRIAANNFRKWQGNPRYYILALLLLMFLNIFLAPVRQAAAYVQLPVSAWVFPFLTSNYYSLMLIMFGFVLFLCDAPFVDSEQAYLIIRCGKKTWLKGQLLYICLASAVYFLSVFLMSILLLLPNITFAPDWGKLVRTLSQTDLSMQFNVSLDISYKIIRLYSPAAAMGLSLLMAWLIGVLLGVMLFILNAFFSRAVGVMVTSGMVLLEIFALNNAFRFTYVSPVSWMSLSILDTEGFSKYPTLSYTLICTLLIIFTLSAIALRWSKKRDIKVLPPL